jgi:MFS transporter, DHA3 family, macrolide efflux protein
LSTIVRRTALSVPGYRPFLLGSCVSSLGDGMDFVAIAWLLVQLGGTSAQMGLLLAATSLPGVLLSPVIGVLVDRWDRRLTCVAMDACRAGVTGGLAALAAGSALRPWHLYGGVLVVATCDRFHWPAAGGLVRELVPRGLLLSANSLGGIATQAGVVVGAGLVGPVIGVLGAPAVLLLNAASFAASAACTGACRRGILRPAATARPSWRADLAGGARYLAAHRRILLIAAVQMSLFLVLYTGNVLLPSFATRVLGAGPVGFGVIDAGWAAGALGGGLLLLARARDAEPGAGLGVPGAVPPAMAALAVALGSLAAAGGVAHAAASYVLMGLFFVPVRIALDTVVQAAVPTNLQGRVKATLSSAIAVVSCCAYLGLGQLADVAGIRWVFAAVAAVTLAGAALAAVGTTRAPASPGPAGAGAGPRGQDGSP